MEGTLTKLASRSQKFLPLSQAKVNDYANFRPITYERMSVSCV